MKNKHGSRSKSWPCVRAGEISALLGLRTDTPGKVAERHVLKANLTGLALSGGGIRSASFSLGVLQALIEYGVVNRFHYLSSVSGGGYTGVAVAWLRKLYKQRWSEQFTSRGARRPRPRLAQTGVWLDFIRQHANYLRPPGIGALDLFGVAVRNLALSVAIYLTLLAVILATAIHFELFRLDRACFIPIWSLPVKPVLCGNTGSLALASLLLMGVLYVFYSFGTYVTSFGRGKELITTAILLPVIALPVLVGLRPALLTDFIQIPDWVASALLIAGLGPTCVGLIFLWQRLSQVIRHKPKTLSTDNGLYSQRLLMQSYGGWCLVAAIALSFAHALPGIERAIHTHWEAWIVALVTAISTTYRTFGGHRVIVPKSLLTQIRIVATFAVVVIVGSAAAYALGELVEKTGDLIGILILAVTTILIAYCTNLNQFGIGRMYRDRLTEAFMPDKNSIGSTTWGKAHLANAEEGLLTNLWPPPQHGGKPSLYPLINTNVVLVDSKVHTYRGRGGDSFVLSPGFCGSDATQWVRTEAFAGGDLKAGTAMAISGAAANPNTAPGGHGFSRNRLVSFLMFLAQARLGAWVGNPKYTGAGFLEKIRGYSLGPWPNFLAPGLLAGLFGRTLSEESYFLELSDGGHFDNTGAYELVRRRAKLIVLAQGSQDADFGFADLANFIEKVRVDFGVRLYFRDGLSLKGIRPRVIDDTTGLRLAKRGHAIAKIRYLDGFEGWFIYLQATPLHNMAADVHSYHLKNPNFPNEPTANQFFREAQLEAYRELGRSVAKRFLDEVCAASARTQASRRTRVQACLQEIDTILQPVAPLVRTGSPRRIAPRRRVRRTGPTPPP